MTFYLAFRKGKAGRFSDDDIMIYTDGAFVHCEILVFTDTDILAFGAWQHDSPCFQARPLDTWFFRFIFHYHFVHIPIPNPQTAFAFLQQITEAKLPYRIGWRCIFPTSLIPLLFHHDPYQDTLDTPEAWAEEGVFCSQIAWLFLLHCFGPSRFAYRDSRCLSPTQLFWIVRDEFPQTILCRSTVDTPEDLIQILLNNQT